MIPVIDNRGTADHPFGFVYMDDTRVGFSQGNGVWLTTGWGGTEEHLNIAKEALDQEFPGWDAKDENV
jgi:hypothetical protein